MVTAMTGIQIFLIFLGILAIICSFVFAERFDSQDSGAQQKMAHEDIEKLTKDIVKEQVDKEVDRIIDDKIEVTEVEMEKLSNEKILAMGDYYETVIGEISKNHDEVMFLYGMLNDKEKDIKNTVRDVENVKKSIVHITEKVQGDMQQENPAATANSADESAYAEGLDSEDESGYAAGSTDAGGEGSLNTEQAVEPEQEEQREQEPTEFRITIQNDNQKKKGVALSHKEARKNTNHNQMILDLYHEGKTNMEIARQLKLGVGEVRLVIDLYRNKK